jgi:hypothetical protein
MIRSWSHIVNSSVIILLLLFSAGCHKTLLKFGIDQPSQSTESTSVTKMSANLRLGGRHYQSSFLKNIFGPDVESITRVRIEKRISEFGDPCNHYEMVGTGIDMSGDPYYVNPEDPDSNCYDSTLPNPSHTMASINGHSNALKEGWRLQACDQIVAVDSNVNFAIQRITGSSNVSTPSEANIKDAFDAFYPGSPPSSDIISALKDVSSSVSTPLDQWRWTLLTLCIAPDWQIL